MSLKTATLFIVGLSLGIGVISCGQKSDAGGGATSTSSADGSLTGNLSIDGSSTVFPATSAVAEEFTIKNKAVKAAVSESGTGGGFKKFAAKEIDIAGASRPIKKEEMEACTKGGVEFIELPIAYDGLTVIVNKENTWAKSLTVEELKKMWSPGSAMNNWKDVRAGFPDVPIKYFGAGTDSGTFDYFTKAIVGTEKSIRNDYAASEDDNVISLGVQGDKGAIGFLGYSYFVMNQEKLAAVQIGDAASAVAPSQESIQGGTYQPLSRPLFIYVSKTAAARPEVKAYIEMLLSKEMQELLTEEGFVPLPDDTYDLVRKRFADLKTGSVFAGDTAVGVKMSELLSKEQ